MVVAELPCFGAESKIADTRQGDWAGRKAFGPFVDVLVLKLDFQEPILDEGNSHLCGDSCIPKAPSLILRQ